MADDKDNVKNDYDYSRETYYELIEKGKDALENMIEVARESEHPRAYEVLSGMIKNVSDVNDRLMDLNKKQKQMDEKDEVKQVENQQNNYFLGSVTGGGESLDNCTIIAVDDNLGTGDHTYTVYARIASGNSTYALRFYTQYTPSNIVVWGY